MIRFFNKIFPSTVTLEGLQTKYEKYQKSWNKNQGLDSLNSEASSDDGWITEEESDGPFSAFSGCYSFKHWVVSHQGVSELRLLRDNGYKLDVLGDDTLLLAAFYSKKIENACFLLKEYPPLRKLSKPAQWALFECPKKDLERLEAAGMDFRVKLLRNPLRLVLRSALKLDVEIKKVFIVTHRVRRRVVRENVINARRMMRLTQPVIQFGWREGKDLLGDLHCYLSPERSEDVKQFLFAHLSPQDRDLLGAPQKDDEAAAVPEGSEDILESAMVSGLSNQ